MLKQSITFSSLFLAAGMLVSGTSVFAESASAETASASNDLVTPLYLSGIYTEDSKLKDISVLHDIRISYEEGCLYDSYRIVNTSPDQSAFQILIPQLTTLSTSPQNLYDFHALSYDETDEDVLSSMDLTLGSREAIWDTLQYYSPVFSSTGLGETSLTLDALYESQVYNTSVPEDKGILYEITRDSAGDSTACLSISDIGSDCHIYPMGCSYTSVDNGYELSISEGYETCYVFLTGSEGTDFTVSSIDEDSFTLTEEDSNLKDYLLLCCSWYLDNNPDKTEVTTELLMSNLADYFGRSSVTVSIDLLPTIDWLTTQKRFLIHEYTITVPAQSTVYAWIAREQELTPSEVVLYPQLAEDSASYFSVTDTMTAVIPDGYSSLIVRNAKSKKLSKTTSNSSPAILSYSVTKYEDDTYSVVLLKTPLWNATLKYLPVFIVIMAVFMLLCVISYFSRKKR